MSPNVGVPCAATSDIFALSLDPCRLVAPLVHCTPPSGFNFEMLHPASLFLKAALTGKSLADSKPMTTRSVSLAASKVGCLPPIILPMLTGQPREPLWATLHKHKQENHQAL